MAIGAELSDDFWEGFWTSAFPSLQRHLREQQG